MRARPRSLLAGLAVGVIGCVVPEYAFVGAEPAIQVGGGGSGGSGGIGSGNRAGSPSDGGAAVGGGASLLPLGAACENDPECDSGYCVDDVCCYERCDELCFTCSEALGAAEPGLCTPIAEHADPENECVGTCATEYTGTPGVCDGAGACKLGFSITCQPPSMCLDGGCTP